MITNFDKKNINQDIPGIITLSHGPLAKAILESAAVIYGEKIENSCSFCLESEDNIEEYKEAFAEALTAFSKGAIVFVDLFGGTPCNQLILYCKKNGLAVNAIAGMNLVMIFNMLYMRESCEMEELLTKIMQEGVNGIVNIKERLK